jgi:hypothetical protein
MSSPNSGDRVVSRTIVHKNEGQPWIRTSFKGIEAHKRVLPPIPIQNNAAYVRVRIQRASPNRVMFVNVECTL